MLKRAVTFLALSTAAVGLAASPAAAAGQSLTLNNQAPIVKGGIRVDGQIKCAKGEEERDITVTVVQGSVVGTGSTEYYCGSTVGSFSVYVWGDFHTGPAKASASSPRTEARDSKNLRDQRTIEVVNGLG